MPAVPTPCYGSGDANIRHQREVADDVCPNRRSALLCASREPTGISTCGVTDTFDADGDLLAAVSSGLELLSLVGIVDPPRPTAKASIATAEAAGIRVRMITGDHAVTAGAIARKIGIHGPVMTGAEFAAMDDDARWSGSTRSGSSPG